MESPGLNRLGYTLPSLLDVTISAPASGNVLQYNGERWLNANVALPSGSYEPTLGNPSVDGYVLSSTISGVRSWVAGGTGSDSKPYTWFLF